MTPAGRAKARAVVVLAAAVVAAAVTARLGFWQLDRARQKTDWQQRIDQRSAQPVLAPEALAADATGAEAQVHRRIELVGRWLPEHTLYLDNRPHEGRAGFLVLTPLQRPDGGALLVVRGWVPRDLADRTRLPALVTPAGPVRVPGRLAPPPSQRIALGEGGDTGPIRQNVALDALGRETGLRLHPLALLQTAAERPADDADGAGAASGAVAPSPDPLVRDWPPVAQNVGKHHGYALQWFALSALVVGLYLWFQILRPLMRRGRHDPS